MMTAKPINCLLITANCGSVFEDPSELLENWIKELLIKIEKSKPLFIALHLQEVGGKTYEKSMEYVQQFINILCESIVLIEYTKIRVFLDEDYSSAEHFTALGNLYFAHKSICELKIWNFITFEFEQVEDKSIYTGNIESVATKEKAKFPQQFFPECKWSRKGFLRTRWNIEGTIVDMINIHLFHDASNLAACEQYPSVYCKSRRRALIHTLERIYKDPYNNLVPFFIFGDFNFRCDTGGVVKELTKNLTEQRYSHLKSDCSKIVFRDCEGSVQLSVGKKEFLHTDFNLFRENWLKSFDKELDPLKSILFEYSINFPPTYPFEENPQLPYHYMPTRCPSWCDRILMTEATKKLIENKANVEYGTIGNDICMGDHKPVFLSISITANKGTVNVCDHIKTKQEHSKENVENEISFMLNYKCRICLDFLNNIIDQTNAPMPLDNRQIPLVNINVVDAEKLNACMCNSIDKTEELTKEYICSKCKLSIQKQSKIISKEVNLGDVIVNQIDNNFLSSTYSPGSSKMRKLTDPYTPESVESHSPQPEIYDDNNTNFINSTIDDSDEIMKVVNKHNNKNGRNEEKKFEDHITHSHSVSPIQLQTRLEILRTESQIEFSSKNIGVGLQNFRKNQVTRQTKRCLCCSCAIL